ncbi:GntR family transcriptional regulator (plasmid) [Streptomyces sp. NBC_00841]|nr:GntR family transcriptional regulator [Streptomyces sp. NBC_00841]WSA05024.1 GntR family transcriptional regulator [Streptomyces sp. NBC_00841]
MVTPPKPEAEKAADSLQASVVEQVAAQLKAEIRQGRLPAGTRLVQGEIATRLGVSGTSVREAFYLLEHLGLIHWDGRRGVRVFAPSVEDLVEVYSIRAALESLAVRLATPGLGSDDLARLEKLQDQMEAPPPEENAFLSLNAQFHTFLAEKAGNRRLARLIDAEQTATSAYVIFLGGAIPTSLRQTHLEHRAILAAIRTGDADLAANAMSVHLTARAWALKRRLNSS